MNQVVLHPQNCTACGLCELVCTFHHSGQFGRAPASVIVLKDATEPHVDLRITREVVGLRQACDDCAGEDSQLCADWCPVGAIVRRRK